MNEIFKFEGHGFESPGDLENGKCLLYRKPYESETDGNLEPHIVLW